MVLIYQQLKIIVWNLYFNLIHLVICVRRGVEGKGGGCGGIKKKNLQFIWGRCHMALCEYAHLEKNHGLKVVEQDKIRWNAPGNPEWLHDGMTKVKKTIMKL